MSTNTKVKNIPLLPLRGVLVYPTMILHIDVGRERSVAALNKRLHKIILFFLQHKKI